MSAQRWSPADIGDLSGAVAMVTGGAGGLGAQLVLGLADRGAHVIATARDPRAARASLDLLPVPTGAIEVIRLDLADLAQTDRAARQLLETVGRIHILINNAGVMIPPFTTTADGYELQMGTNHLGHFAWTARLWPALRDNARVVTVSSLAHAGARDVDPRALSRTGPPRRYVRWRAYAESKLANLRFAFELDRRVRAAGLGAVSVAAHPGVAATDLVRNGLTLRGVSWSALAAHRLVRTFAQPAEHGALPLLRAAVDPTLTGGEYIGPGGPGQLRGAHPQIVTATRRAYDRDLAERLWRASEDAAGVTFDVR